MLDALVHAEGEPDVVQISGGEPTIHPQFFEILDAARARPIKHLMVNTNGVKIANDAAFAERLASYMPGFEIYLQFDSLDAGPQLDLRGVDLTDIRRRALERLNALNLSTTLVVTIKRGLNDDALGQIVDFALEQPCVRGVTFQPVQEAGRNDGFDEAAHRITLTEVRRRILEQTEVFQPADIIPVPCHPDSLAMAYALKTPMGPMPLTGMIDPSVLLAGPEVIRREAESRGDLAIGGLRPHRPICDCLVIIGGPVRDVLSPMGKLVPIHVSVLLGRDDRRRRQVGVAGLNTDKCRPMLKPARRCGRTPERLALRVLQVPLDRLQIGINRLIIRAIDLDPVPVRVENIEEERIRNAVPPRPTLDIADIASRGHQVQQVDDVQRRRHPERNVVQPRPLSVGEGHIMHPALAVHPGCPETVGLLILSVFGHPEPKVTVECHAVVDIGRKDVEVVDAKRLNAFVSRVFLMDRRQAIHLVIKLEWDSHIV